MYDIIIIGAGPAGLTAALYAKRSGKKVLVLESKSYGGQIIKATKIENYPGIKLISGFDFANNLYNQVKDLGCDIVYETVVKIEEDKTVITNKNKYKARAIIIATGSQNRKLNIENEKELIGKGVSYCATCDGNFYKDKVVAVYGKYEDAVLDAKYLSNIASKTYLILTENKTDINVDNVEVINNAKITKLNKDENLKSIDILINNEQTNIDIDGLFISLGREPKNEIFKNIVDLDEFGYIITTDGVHTKTKGIYAAGDTRVKELRQLTTSVSDGSLAATIAIKELI